MKAEYKRECTGNVLILEDEYGYSFENYQVRMLTGNKIPMLLECRVQMLDAVLFFHYQALDYEPISEKYARKGMQYQDMEGLLLAIDRVMKATSEYLLPGTGVVLDPPYIFTDSRGNYYFCYLPGKTGSFAETFRKLSEYVLDHMDYGEREGVILGYGIYRKSQEPQSCMESLIGLLQKPASFADQAADDRNDDYEIWEGDGWKKASEPVCDIKSLQGEKDTAKSWIKEDGKTKKKGVTYKKAKWIRPVVGILLGVLTGGIALGRAYLLTGTEIRIEAAPTETSRMFLKNMPWVAAGVLLLLLGLFVVKSRKKRKQDSALRDLKPLKPIEPTRYLGSRAEEMSHKLVQMDTQEEYPLSGTYIRIGKDPVQVDLCLQKETISRVHAAVFSKSGEWYVQDLDSTNGTFRNGCQLDKEEKVLLAQGDELMFADQAFLFL